MMERNLAIITGADGGMGTEITKAVAFAGYHVIMACYNPVKAEPVKQRIIRETGIWIWRYFRSIWHLWNLYRPLPVWFWGVLIELLY